MRLPAVGGGTAKCPPARDRVSNIGRDLSLPFYAKCLRRPSVPPHASARSTRTTVGAFWGRIITIQGKLMKLCTERLPFAFPEQCCWRSPETSLPSSGKDAGMEYSAHLFRNASFAILPIFLNMKFLKIEIYTDGDGVYWIKGLVLLVMFSSGQLE